MSVTLTACRGFVCVCVCVRWIDMVVLAVTCIGSSCICVKTHQPHAQLRSHMIQQCPLFCCYRSTKECPQQIYGVIVWTINTAKAWATATGRAAAAEGCRSLAFVWMHRVNDHIIFFCCSICRVFPQTGLNQWPRVVSSSTTSWSIICNYTLFYNTSRIRAELNEYR